MIIYIFSILLILLNPAGDTVIIDSNVTLKDALTGKEIPEANKRNLTILNVQYYSFDNKVHSGQLVIAKDLAQDIREIFALIKEKRFRIKKVIPVNNYKWDDEASMLDNNTSAFNYRVVSGTRTFSAHATGRAIDINPYLNPMIRKNSISPKGARYIPAAPGTISRNSWVLKEFRKRGWRWGGDWTTMKDYQHFEKTIGNKK